MFTKLLITYLFAIQTVLAGFPPTTMKGQSESTKTTTFNFEVPHNQATKTGAGTALIETGNDNVLRDPELEGSALLWSTYADAAGSSPVDGVGGAPSVSVAYTSTLPLNGKKSLLFTKDASNRQGQGAALDFSIPDINKGKVNRLKFSYEITSGTYASGDTSVWIYDVTNARLIQPSAYTIENSGLKESKFVEFQSSIDSNLYRLIIHVTSTSASVYTLKFDSFSVGLMPKVYGSVTTDWKSSTATINWTNSTIVIEERRVGDSIEYRGRVTVTGNPSGASLVITLPRSYDLTKTRSGVVGDVSYIVDVSASIDYTAIAYPFNATQVSIVYISNASPLRTYPNVSPSAPITFASGDYIEFYLAPRPVLGWSSSQQLSQDADTRVVVAKATGSTQNIAQSATTTIINPTVEIDTHGAYNSSTGIFTVPSAGVYRVTVNARRTSASGTVANELRLNLYKGGVLNTYLASYIYETTSSQFAKWNGSALINCVAGDTLSAAIVADTNTGSAILTSTLSNITFEKISGPSQIAASETVAASYWLSSNFSSNSTTPVNFDSKEFDTHNAVTTSATAWKFTAPVSGIYSFGGYIYPNTVNIDMIFRKNGSNYKIAVNTPNSTSPSRGSYYALIRLLAGEYIDLVANSSSTIIGGALNSNGGSNINIVRVGNY